MGPITLHRQGTNGINSKKRPEGLLKKRAAAATRFPHFHISMYDPATLYSPLSSESELTPSTLKSVYSDPTRMAQLKRLHHEAANRRQSLWLSLAVTRQNTAKSGSKVEGGESLTRFYSGFNETYVMAKLAQALEDDTTAEELASDFMELIEGEDIGITEEALTTIFNGKFKSASPEAKLAHLHKLTQEVMHRKWQSCVPKAAVAA